MTHCFSRPGLRAGFLCGLVAAGVITIALVPSGRSTARPPASLTPGLQYVPPDSAMFVCADAARIWDSTIGKALRAADPKTVGELTAQAKTVFGVPPDALETATLFWPKLKGPQDMESFGVVLTFKAPFDGAKLKAGLEKLPGKRTRSAFHTPSDRVAVWLVGLGDEYARPRPAGQSGPLTGAIREASAGKHLLVAASALASLPDEIRGDDLPQSVRAFRPLFRAESITGVVDLGPDLSVEVRVKTATPAKAVEAEKALGALAGLVQEGLAQGVQVAGKDPAVKDLLAILKAAQTGLKGAKFETDGDQTRAAVTVPADLPFGPAFAGAAAKVRESATRTQSVNNLKQIGIALHNYGDANNGHFPPAAVVDKTGKPLLSWRVLILPYVEQAALYKEFKLDEPWDGEHNKKLLGKMPRVFALPGDPGTKTTETYYRVFVGTGAAFDYLKGPRMPADFPDGTSNTVLVATAAESVPWTKPDELGFDPDKDMRKLLGFVYNDTCPVGLADGSVRLFSRAISKETLHAAITRNGGEVLGPDF